MTADLSQHAAGNRRGSHAAAALTPNEQAADGAHSGGEATLPVGTTVTMVVDGPRARARRAASRPFSLTAARVGSARRGMTTRNIDVANVYALWPSADSARTAIPVASRRAKTWAQRTGVLGGGSSAVVKIATRSAPGAVLASALAPAVALVGQVDARAAIDGASLALDGCVVKYLPSSRLADAAALDEALRWAYEQWHDWLPGESPAPGDLVVSRAGRESDMIMFLHADRGAAPRVVLKATSVPLAEAEFRSLRDVRAQLPSMRDTVPRPLAYRRVGDFGVVAAEALPGRRLLMPELAGRERFLSTRLLRRYVRPVLDWSRDLASAGATGRWSDGVALADGLERLESRLEQGPAGGARLRSFRRAVASADIPWQGTWQHGDPAAGNVLRHGTAMRMVDWADAGPRFPPWFDAAYVALSLARSVGVRGTGAPESLRRVLSPTTWIGAVVRAELDRVWSHPLPLGWALALTAAEQVHRAHRLRHPSTSWYAAVAHALVADDDVRAALGHAAPQW